MSFLQGTDGKPLVVYRGERASALEDQIRSKSRMVYFTSKEAAHHDTSKHSTFHIDGMFYTPRIYPVWLEMDHPFVNQPDNPMLDVKDLVIRLGQQDALRIVERFHSSIESTGYWTDHLNKDRKYEDLFGYLEASEDCLEGLYFKASHFFESEAEVARLTRLGYDGAIHAGFTIDFKQVVKYCVFNKSQIHYPFARGNVNEVTRSGLGRSRLQG